MAACGWRTGSDAEVKEQLEGQRRSKTVLRDSLVAVFVTHF